MKRMTITLATLAAMALPATGCWWAYCEDDDNTNTNCQTDIYRDMNDGLLYYCDCNGENCSPWSCTDNSDCDAYSQCNEVLGQCQETWCWDNSDCPDGTMCLLDNTGYEGVCVGDDFCLDDYDCPLGSSCNTSTNQCEADNPGCNERADCSGDDICVGNECVAPPTSCENNAECGSGAYCEDGACITSGLCGDASDCLDPAAPTCENGTCVPDAPQWECEDNTGCASGERCVNGQCETEPTVDPADLCYFDEQCEGGLCINGECQANCTSVADCGAGQECLNDHCVDVETPGDACILNTDCGANEVCLNGTCLGGCVDDNDCPGASDHCDAGICLADNTSVPECVNNTDCNGIENCVDGVCRTPCADANDCIACGMPVCHLTYCYDAVPQCVTAGDCNAGETCADSQCVTP